MFAALEPSINNGENRITVAYDWGEMVGEISRRGAGGANPRSPAYQRARRALTAFLGGTTRALLWQPA
jgi:hypothetical protein